ncbi:MAG: hypothetical protein ACFFDP_09765, partial [Promethearchaeota archaeon]
SILEKAYHALAPNGFLLLELHTFEAVAKIGEKPSSWHSAKKGLFSEEPYLCLEENFWDTEHNVTIQRYYIVDAMSGEVIRYSSSMQAYTDEEYRLLLSECGFGEAVFYPSLGGGGGDSEDYLKVILSQKVC